MLRTCPVLKVTNPCAAASTSVLPSLLSGMPHGPLKLRSVMKSSKVWPRTWAGSG